MPTANSVSVASGSKAVTGNETIFTGYPGDLILINGLAAIVASFEDASHLTLVQPWPVASVVDEDSWAIVPTAAERSSTVTLSNRLAAIIDRIEDGFALGNVTGLAEALAAKANAQAVSDALAGKASKMAFDAHTGASNNPHGVTKGQVGLGSADNTADVDKPVSTAVAQALADGLAGKVAPSGSGIAADHLALFTSSTGKAIKSGGKVGGAATRDVGTTQGTVAAGDDARIVPIAPRLQPTHGALLAADARRLIRFTGTSSQVIGKAADLGAGWSVYLSNEGPGIQTFTPDGAELIDGLGGSRLLLPKQRALLVCNGVGFSWIWLDREPVLSTTVVASSVAFVDVALPDGWTDLEIEWQDILCATAGSTFVQGSLDGTNVDAGANSYAYATMNSLGTSSTGTASNTATGPYILVGGSGVQSGGNNFRGEARLDIAMGAGKFTRVTGRSGWCDGNGFPFTCTSHGYMGPLGPWKKIRFASTGGNLLDSTITVKGRVR